MKSNPAAARSTVKSRRAQAVSREARFWLDLRASYDQSKANGLTFEQARRRLEAREATQARSRRRKPARKS